MAAADIWSELGLAQTTDTRAIRLAYAARLKTLHPDTDPQRLARLREAYAQAMRAAEAALKHSSPVRPSPAPLPAPAVIVGLSAAPHAEFTAVTSCMQRGYVQGAASHLSAARISGALSLEQDLRLADRLGWMMAHDRTLSADAVRMAADRLGWLRSGMIGPWAGP